jgi:hypothetical protein
LGGALALLTSATLAHAEPPASERSETELGLEPPAAATALDPLEQADALLEAGDDHEALQVLLRAAAATPSSARVRVHLAAVHQALGEWLAAEDQLVFALQQSHDPYVEEHREALGEALESIQSHLARLLVTGEPAGAEVYLDGRRLGTLPLEAPARVVAGAHVLRASQSGYRTWSASIDADPDTSVNQVIRLAADEAPRGHAFAPTLRASAPTDVSPQATSNWSTLTLGGLGTAAAVTSAVAFTLREVHAGHWNSNACIAAGQRRGDVCPSERAAIEDWDRVMLVSGVAAGALLAGALLSWSLEASPPDEVVSLSDCSVSLGQLSCRGRF